MSLACIYESKSQTKMKVVCWRVVEIQLDKETEIERACMIQTMFCELGELRLEPKDTIID